jgi:uncharacterized membrane protein (DUF106 family)
MFEAIGNAIDSALLPLLKLPPFLVIALVAFVLSLLITVIYKYTTNQKELKSIRDETKTIQDEMKAVKGDMAKMTELNQRLLGLTSKQMQHTFKSYIFTFLPVILIFGWLQGHMAYTPILPGEVFTTTAVFEKEAFGNVTLSAPGLELLSPATQEVSASVIWKLKGDAGKYALEYTYGKEVFQREAIISNSWEYANEAPTKGISKASSVSKIKVDLEPLHPLGFSIFGWQPGWFATYFILTMLFTFPLRKLIKVY